ncbi:MAG: IS110 family transposase [Chloroflexi bacterium]|nr:IS110 family transposase [Chloroflexota bacterium]
METKSKVIVGIDWSRDQHQVNVFNEAGQAIVRFSIKHTQQGFASLHQKLSKLEPNSNHILIAIETHHNQLVDFLFAQGYEIYVIAPTVVKGNRSRQSHAGAKSDNKDADLLADILRTDRLRLTPWQPDGKLVQKIRNQLSLIDDLTIAIVQGRNRLEAQLLRYFPQAIDVFSDLMTQIALKLLIEYPTPSAVAALDFKTFKEFCLKNRYTNKAQLPKRYARLQRPSPFWSSQAEGVFAPAVPILAQRLLTDVQLKVTLIKGLQKLFNAHPDEAIYNSVPGTGKLIAPQLLAIFGDHRELYPSPNVVRALAGTCPATSQSGKKRGVFFRKACNHKWRNTFQLLAKASVSSSDWAATYYEETRLRGKKKSHAYRCLANRWVGIIWTLWQREQVYDETIHLRHVTQHKRNRAKLG